MNDSLKAHNEEIFNKYQSECEKSLVVQAELKQITKQLIQAEEALNIKAQESMKVDAMVDRVNRWALRS